MTIMPAPFWISWARASTFWQASDVMPFLKKASAMSSESRPTGVNMSTRSRSLSLTTSVTTDDVMPTTEKDGDTGQNTLEIVQGVANDDPSGTDPQFANAVFMRAASLLDNRNCFADLSGGFEVAE